MKLKIRFEPKDMIVFGIFALIIFLLIAIAISNIVYFGEYGKLYGFSPFYALYHGYLLVDLLNLKKLYNILEILEFSILLINIFKAFLVFCSSL